MRALRLRGDRPRRGVAGVDHEAGLRHDLAEVKLPVVGEDDDRVGGLEGLGGELDVVELMLADADRRDVRAGRRAEAAAR